MDEKHLATPDRPGNRRVDTFQLDELPATSDAVRR
jgi:hypothetical protein